MWLNYHHLFYFWHVVREGSITKACSKLYLSQPTISAQLKTLEVSLGVKLLSRNGRNLALTEAGQLAYRYADEIYSRGNELVSALKGEFSGKPQRLLVGVADVVPKLIVYRLLRPALFLPQEVHMVCRENKPEPLLADLAVDALDVVLSDAPVSPQVKVRVFSHLLGECGMSVFGNWRTYGKYTRRFPQSLHGAPLLMPTDNTTVRRSIDQWCVSNDILPRITGECEDAALLNVFGQARLGMFFAPTPIEKEVCQQYSVKVIGRIAAVRARFYAISVERKLKHPAVVAISEAARKEIFGADRRP